MLRYLCESPNGIDPSANHILPLSPFRAASCPIVILLPILAPHGLPLARFTAFKAVQAASAIWLTAPLLGGKIGSPLLMKF